MTSPSDETLRGALEAELAEVTDVAKGCAKREAQYFTERNALLVALKRVKILLCHAASRHPRMSQQFERKKAKEAVEVIDAALTRTAEPREDVVERDEASLFALNLKSIAKRERNTGNAELSAVIDEAALMIDRLSALPAQGEPKEARYWERPFGDARDALDFACDHCEPEEALAFLEDWRSDRGGEWPGYMKWLAVQQEGAKAAAMRAAAPLQLPDPPLSCAS